VAFEETIISETKISIIDTEAGITDTETGITDSGSRSGKAEAALSELSSNARLVVMSGVGRSESRSTARLCVCLNTDIVAHDCICIARQSLQGSNRSITVKYSKS